MKSVAVLGASNDRGKFGNKAVRAFLAKGFRVFPVNPKETEVEGLTAYPELDQLPAQPEVITVYLPPPVLLKLLPAIAACGCEELWLNPGTASEEVRREAKRLQLPVIEGCSIVALGISPATL